MEMGPAWVLSCHRSEERVTERCVSLLRLQSWRRTGPVGRAEVASSSFYHTQWGQWDISQRCPGIPLNREVERGGPNSLTAKITCH